MQSALVRLWEEEQGQDLVEYSLLIVLVALATIGAVSNLANAISKVFASAAMNLTSS